MQYRNLIATGIFIFCLIQLSGCSFIRSHRSSIDGPPAADAIDVAKIANAVPKEEPYHPYGNKDYVVLGRRYHVLKNPKGYVKIGYASWYGSKFHGKHTSTQERYNLYGMTAASKELPLPSYVQVTNLNNGKKIVVRVNDRGPFHSKRIIDLSYAGAKKLGFVNSGVALVKVEAINPKTWGKNTATKTKTIYLQVGAFTSLDNAKQLSTKIARLIDKPTNIYHRNNLYRVHIGPIACATQGNKLKQVLEKNGFNKVVVITN